MKVHRNLSYSLPRFNYSVAGFLANTATRVLHAKTACRSSGAMTYDSW